MKTSELLTRAKRHLAKNQADVDADKTRYVCVAISRVDSSLEIKRLMRRIDKALDNNSLVAVWLQINGHATVEQTSNITVMQEYRHRWLDSLIEEYRGKGD